MLKKIRTREFWFQVLKQLICITMVIIVVLPILLTLFASLKNKGDMVTTSPLALPSFDRITLENYAKVFQNKYLLIGFKNTLIILVVSIFFNVILGTVTAYIIERFKFRYRQFISTIPAALDESALLDGCSYFGVFARIIFPLLAPATATVVIIKAITIINDMYIPYLYMPKNKLRTLTTFLMDYANAQQGSWQTLAAGIIVIMLPTILIYVFFQRYILAGIAAGAVKE